MRFIIPNVSIVKMSETLLAWHFVGSDGRIRPIVGEGEHISAHSGILVVPGLKLTVPGPPVPKKWGLHAAEIAAAAVFQAPGLRVCRVRLSGQIVRDPGGFHVCATERECLWTADAHNLVWEWLCRCFYAKLTSDEGQRMQTLYREAAPIWQGAYQARWAWCKEGMTPRVAAAINAVRSSARKYWCLSQGRPNGTSTRSRREPMDPVAIHLSRIAYGLVRDPDIWADAACRPRGWFKTAQGRREAQALDTMLARLDPERAATEMACAH